MITGNINKLTPLDKILPEDLQYCIDYAHNHDLINYPTGWYPTDRPHIRFRIDEYSTQIPSERFWESHKYHLDFYILLRGQEEIQVCPTHLMEPYHYIVATDLMMYEDRLPETKHRLTQPGDFLICQQTEAHKTGINVDLRNVFKIVLFKIYQDL